MCIYAYGFMYSYMYISLWICLCMYISRKHFAKKCSVTHDIINEQKIVITCKSLNKSFLGGKDAHPVEKDRVFTRVREKMTSVLMKIRKHTYHNQGKIWTPKRMGEGWNGEKKNHRCYYLQYNEAFTNHSSDGNL